MKAVFAVLSGLLGLYAFIPYLRSILKGNVRPARSARIMFVILLTLALFQQKDLGSKYALGITVGEWVGSLAILISSIKYGMGGLRKLDFVCYALLGLDLIIWLTTNNSLLALHLTVLADFIAGLPTLEKSWKHPSTELPEFFILGSIAALLSVAAAPKLGYGIVLFPLYLAVWNGFVVLLLLKSPKRSV